MTMEILGNIGKCIYCGETKEPLTDEHIVPLAFNGRWILQKASCQKCAEIISKFELNVLRHQFGSRRSAFGFKTRRKHKVKFPVKFTTASGEEKIVELPVREYGSVIILPVFPPPAILSKRDRKKINIILGFLYSRDKGLLEGELCKKYNAKSVIFSSIANPFDFARFLAKVAYGFSVAKFGFKKIKKAYVLPAILKKTEDIGKWVGCCDLGEEKNIPRPVPSPGHYISISTKIIETKNKEIITQIRLFDEPDFPTYSVIVGSTSWLRSFLRSIYK